MRISVRLFGPPAALVGSTEVEVDFDHDAPTGAQLLEHLAAQLPELQDAMPAARLAVNHQFASNQQVIQSEDEVALIAMISGG